MIYAIVGPTASGKTDLAIKLAKKFSCPIINADAFQIYQDMNIGTGKLSAKSKEYKMHYLLDVITPNETYSVKQYQIDFRKTLNQLLKIYPNVIICGGTGLYLKAGLYDYEFPDEEVPDTSDLEKLDNETLYQMLKEVDPKACETIHINNKKRVIRALSLARNHDENKSEIIDKQTHEMIYQDVKIYMLSPDRTKLYENINHRVEKMFENGLVEEVKELLNKYELSVTAKAAIGYKEVLDYLDNKMTLEDCVALVQQRSRNYAKRQVTFFKHQLPCIVKETADEIFEDILNG
ncbi:MAG: tRNA (adenosine(37)-N6)-dimethylallyltransferase MiaA [Bacilli bacterium]|nr:tRNA (adenosine(37)-N6)-dimethylallyltransferase MiaA [Bacilli bacterium]